MDRVVALLLIIIALPIILAAIIVLAFTNRGRTFFVQKRIGYREKRITIFKLRTLWDAKDRSGNLLPDEQRTFPAGQFLRRFHIDELPQLFAILIGNMSFIGPRPLLPEYLPYYTAEQKQRHDVKPGLTGLSQVQGGNTLDWNVRLKLDSYYAKNACFALDWKILVKTVRNFFSGKVKKSSAVFSEHFVEYLKKNPVRGLKP